MMGVTILLVESVGEKPLDGRILVNLGEGGLRGCASTSTFEHRGDLPLNPIWIPTCQRDKTLHFSNNLPKPVPSYFVVSSATNSLNFGQFGGVWLAISTSTDHHLHRSRGPSFPL